MSGFISDLSHVLFHDYRSGTFRDWSGNGNHGVGSGARFLRGGKGVVLTVGTGVITVPDSLLLRLTEGTLWIALNMWRYADLSQAILISKREVATCNYSWRCDAVPRFNYYDSDGFQRTLNVAYKGMSLIAINIRDGEIPTGYLNGLSAGAYSGVLVVTPDDSPVRIGNRYLLERALNVPILAAGICDRRLSGNEHARLFAEVIGE